MSISIRIFSPSLKGYDALDALVLKGDERRVFVILQTYGLEIEAIEKGIREKSIDGEQSLSKEKISLLLESLIERGLVKARYLSPLPP